MNEGEGLGALFFVGLGWGSAWGGSAFVGEIRAEVGVKFGVEQEAD